MGQYPVAASKGMQGYFEWKSLLGATLGMRFDKFEVANVAATKQPPDFTDVIADVLIEPRDYSGLPEAENAGISASTASRSTRSVSCPVLSRVAPAWGMTFVLASVARACRKAQWSFW